MNRIRGRAKLLLVLVLVLAVGLGAFSVDYICNAKNWVMASGSPHVYAGSKPASGVITDRNDVLLMDLSDGKSYGESEALRTSFLHWLGDRQGNVSTPLLSHFTDDMISFNPVNGVYTYGGTAPQLRLTLDASVQMAALEAMGSYKGTIAVYNYKTGEILCALSTPTFDPENVPDIAGDTTGAYTGAYMNRFLQSTYTPGSIFKIVTVAAALETIPDIEEQHFTCKGTLAYGNDKVTCEQAHGTLSFQEAFSNSCNCCFAQIADLLGGEVLERYAQQFGITQGLSFDGITSAAGKIEAAQAAPVQVAWSAIGQHKDLVNPCRYLAFVGSIANGGVGVTPHVVSAVELGNKTTYRDQAQSMGRLLSTATAEKLQEYLRINVRDYYGESLFPGLTVCAKSGTAEVGGGRKPNAMFTGFVADEEYPLAFLVAIEDGGYGKQICMPVLAPVLEACKKAIDAQ